MFSGSRKIPTFGSTFRWETRQASFPTGTVGPRIGIFLFPLNTNDGFDLSHIPVPANGKDKKRTAACRLHAGHTSIRVVIVMLKWRHLVKSQCIQDFLEAFFMFFFQHKMRNLVGSKKKKNPIFVWGWKRKVPPLTITVCHHSASLVMPIGVPQDGIFYPTLTFMIDSYSPRCVLSGYRLLQTKAFCLIRLRWCLDWY